jgi:hypothetical protein
MSGNTGNLGMSEIPAILFRFSVTASILRMLRSVNFLCLGLIAQRTHRFLITFSNGHDFLSIDLNRLQMASFFEKQGEYGFSCKTDEFDPSESAQSIALC